MSPWSTFSLNWMFMVEPPLKSMPVRSPGAIMKKTTPGRIARSDIRKNQCLFDAKSKV
jgi:hypothetical protein